MKVGETQAVVPARDGTINIAGGLNESRNYSQMLPGELIFCSNYTQLDSTSGGATSVKGYEIFDGKLSTVTDPANPPGTLEVTLASEVPVLFNSDFTDADDTIRETKRASISELPETVKILGLFELDRKEYAVTVIMATGLVEVYEPHSDTGWTSVFSDSISGAISAEDISFREVQGRFSSYPVSAPNTQSVCITTGFSYAYLFTVEAGVFTGVPVVHPQLNNPNTPTSVDIFNDRLFLFYKEGLGFHCHTGEPLQWDASISTAGAWSFGSEVVDHLVMPSSLFIFMNKGIDVIKLSDPDINTNLDMIKEPFSTETRVKKGTVKKFMGTALYCSERGIEILETAADYGSFNFSSLTKRIQKTYRNGYDKILSAQVDRKTNQYEVYLTTGKIITLSMTASKRVDAIGIHDLGRNIDFVHTPNNSDWKYFVFSGSNGIYIQHEDCTSFNGSAIRTEFTTSYYDGRQPSVYRTLVRAILTHTADAGTQFTVQALFDYSSPDTKSGAAITTEPTPTSDRYGSSSWGSRIYGGSGEVTQSHCGVSGMGRNIAFNVVTESKFHLPHTIHNIIPAIVKNGFQI